jgi:hypothetical protein
VSLSAKSAAHLALYLSIAHPGLFDAFVASLPGASAALHGLGAFGDDTTDYSGVDLSSDTSDTGALTPDDLSLNQDLRMSDPTYDFPVVPGSTPDLVNQGYTTTMGEPVMGSLADASPLIDVSGLTSSSDTALTQTGDIASITPALQSVSASHAVAAIGAPAVAAASSALQTSAGLQALSGITQAYLQDQYQAGQSAQNLQLQSQSITGAIQMANLLNPKLPTTVVTGANGQPVTVLANSPSGTPLVGANGQYIPASATTGILSALTGSSSLMPLLLLGGAAVLLMALFGGSSGGGGGGYEPAPRRRSPRFMEID